MNKPLSDKIKFLISALIVLCSYIIVAAFYPMQYYTHDETDIQYTLSGAFSGTPYPNHPYINILLGKPLSVLYSLIPSVQWWYVYGTVLLVAGAVLIYFSVLKMAEKYEMPLCMALTIIVGIDVVFIVPLIANYAYTLIGAVFGTGVLSVFFWFDRSNKKKRVSYYIFSVVGYLLVYIYRKETGAVILCFLLLTFFMTLVVERGFNLKSVLLSVLFCALLGSITLGLTAIKKASDEKYNGQGYTEFFEAWRNCRDYPFDTIEKNPELYKEAGWGEYEYWMFRSYRGTTDAMTTDSYKYIHENSLDRTAYRKNIKEGIETTLQDGEFRGVLLYYALIIVVLFVMLIQKFSWSSLFWILCNNCGLAILSGYLLLRGRFIYRSAYVIFIPTVIINIYFIIRERIELKNTAKYVLAVFILIVSAVSTTSYFSTKTDRKEALEKCKAITTYELKNKDNIFICLGSTYENYNPWMTFPDDKPINHMYGYSFRWGVSKEQMRANGLDENSELSPFLSDKTLILTEWDCDKKTGGNKYNNSFYCYYDYLKEKCGCIGFVKMDAIPGTEVYVYKLLFDEEYYYPKIYDVKEGEVIKNNK